MSEISQNGEYDISLAKNCPHGRRKFWTTRVWNLPKWRSGISSLLKLSPWLKKLLNYEGVKSPKMKEWDIFFAKKFTMVEENLELRESEISQNERMRHIFCKNFHHPLSGISSTKHFLVFWYHQPGWLRSIWIFQAKSLFICFTSAFWWILCV